MSIPPIVDDELAKKARDVAQAWYANLPRRTPTERRFILSNLLYCAVCGGELRGTTDRPGRAVYKHRKAKGSCPVMQVSADDLEGEMLKLFDGLQFSDAELKALEAKWAEDGLDAQPETAGDRERQERYLAQREQRAKRLFLAGDLTEDKYEAEKRSSQRQRAEFHSRFGPSRAENVKQMVEILQHFTDVIQASDAAQQRGMIEAICERIETNGEEITRVVPRRWFAEFFSDLARIERRLQGHVEGYPQGNSNPRRHLERVVS